MILARDKPGQVARLKRRSVPVHFYTGKNGAGKSLCAVYDTLPTLDAGRPVLSTVRLLDYRNPRPCEGWENGVTAWELDDSFQWHAVLGRIECTDEWHGREGHYQAHPAYVGFRDWEQLLNWKFGDVVMDEITGIADSGQNTALPAAVENLLAQMRRADIAVRITAISWIRANKRLREAVLAVTRCEASMPVPQRKLPEGYNRIWIPRRLAKWTTYDAQTLPIDDHTTNAYAEATKLVKARHWIPTSEAAKAYETNAPVLTVGTVTDSGRCAHCGGTRRAPECECADYVEDRQRRKGAHTHGEPRAARSRREPVSTPADTHRGRPVPARAAS